MLGKFSTVIRSKSFSHKGLGRTRPAPVAVSPYLTTTYDKYYSPQPVLGIDSYSPQKNSRLALDSADLYGMMVEKELIMVAFANRDSCSGVQCRHCRITYSIMYNRQDMVDWLSGSGFIQDLMPYLSAGERELLISGTCDSCFSEMFGIDNEEDE